jgi:hypothetical protein
VKPSGTGEERSADPASPDTNPHPVRAEGLWEVFLSAENLARALKRVEVNRGAPGSDGMSTTELRLQTGGSCVRCCSRYSGPGNGRRPTRISYAIIPNE